MSGIINFSKMPTVGFSHHFYSDKEYSSTYGMEKSIELVYVESGGLLGKLGDHEFRVDEGCFLVLFRHLPISLYTDGKTPHSHCCIQLLGDYEFEFLPKNNDDNGLLSGLAIPFVTPPCEETEELKKILFSAVSDVGISKEENGLCAAISGLTILQKISRIYKKRLQENQTIQSILKYRIKKYVASNLSGQTTLDEIARHMDRTANYINFVFKKECGMSIGRYINQEKVRLLCEMIHLRNISFKVACENVGITDISYGYRLFKKHTGLTPREYLSSKSRVI